MATKGRIERINPSVPELSFVIPYFDERESLEILYNEIVDRCDDLNRTFEIVFVDDGSRDGSTEVVSNLAAGDDRIVFIRFRRNFGKSAALSAGFRVARGDIVFSMDADLQDDPAEIGNFLAALAEGADCVSGWKRVRNDPMDKTLPSKLFNAAVNKVFGLELNDHNCGFKAYRRDAIDELELYGELHRFVPVLLFARGYRIAEIPVQHRARRFGRSKFGAKRLITGGLDLLTVALTTRYGARPLHLFGGIGLFTSLVGAVILAYLSVLWLIGAGPIGDRPLLLFGVLFVLTGGQLIGVGLIGELMLHRTVSEKDKYSIVEMRGGGHEGGIPIRRLHAGMER